MTLTVTPELIEAAALKIARCGAVPEEWSMFDCREYAKLALTGAAEWLDREETEN